MKRERVPEYITPEQAAMIIKACPRQRDKLILRTMWETGGRVDEVLSLVPRNIDKGDNCIYLPNLKQIHIRRKGKKESKEYYKQRKLEWINWKKQRKHKIEENKGPLRDKDDPPLKKTYLFPGSTLCDDLLNYGTENGIGDYKWLFQSDRSRSGKVSTTYIWYLLSSDKETNTYSSRTWKRHDGIITVLNIIKLKNNIRKPAWPHLFRHGAAMNIYQKTGRLDVVQYQLGHTTIQTTEIYAGLTDETRKKIIEDSANN